MSNDNQEARNYYEETTSLSFGKYKDIPIYKIPANYLVWLKYKTTWYIQFSKSLKRAITKNIPIEMIPKKKKNKTPQPTVSVITNPSSMSAQRIKDIYNITKVEITNGTDIYKYIDILYSLIKSEDFEACEGIRLAIADIGLQFYIPNNETELDTYFKWREKNNLKP